MSPTVQERIHREVGPPPGPSALLALAGSRLREEAWNLNGLSRAVGGTVRSRAIPLPWLGALMKLWEPLFEAGRSPGEELVHEVLASGKMGERDLPVFRSLLDAAMVKADRVAKDLPSQLRSASNSTDDADEKELCHVLLNVLQEAKRVRKAGVGAFVAHPSTAPLGRWTIENLDRFLVAFWAMRKTFEERTHRLVARYNAFRKLAGAYKDLGNFSENHSLDWEEPEGS